MVLLKEGLVLALFVFTFLPDASFAWDSDDLELFDLVEEIQQNFYEVLGLDQVSLSLIISHDSSKLKIIPIKFMNCVWMSSYHSVPQTKMFLSTNQVEWYINI